MSSLNNHIAPGVYIAAGVTVPESVTIGPNAVVMADVTIAEEVEIGANATIMEGVALGLKARIMPATLVTKNVPPMAIVQGNPARIIGYHATCANRQLNEALKFNQDGIYHSEVGQVTLHSLKYVPDLRGALSVGEFDRDIPFLPKRYFIVFDVPSAETRGEHAHHECHQFLIAIKGSVDVVVDDGKNREEFTLNLPNLGLHLPPMTWGIQYNYSPDAVLLVFASHYYDSNEYIRDYHEFIKLTQTT